MTIRAKLTLWYAAVLFASLMLCSTLLYHEWVVEPRINLQRHEKESSDPFDDLVQNIFYTAVPATVLGLGGGWLLMRKVLAPVIALTEAAEKVNENNLNVHLPRTGSGDEIDRLTDVFDRMTARLADSFQRIREFTLHASHELKTPLTIMRGSMETALNKEQMTRAQTDLLLDQIDEVDRLTKIVDGLTLLTKADAGLITLNKEHIRLETLIHEIYADGQVLARPHNLTVHLEECDGTIIVAGDNNRLRQMLLNLVDNAVKYNHTGGTVNLSLKRSGPLAEITISNSGPVVPPGMLSRLFDPFFRVDASHTRETDGCGLGLTIVHWIVTAHGGSVVITSHPGSGTTATVFLPSPVDFIKTLDQSQTS